MRRSWAGFLVLSAALASCKGGGSEGGADRPVAPVIATFGGIPTAVVEGADTPIAWTWTYANAPGPTPICTIDHDVGAVTSGSSTNVTLAAATTFTLTCTNDGGSDTAETTIAVVPAPVAPVIGSFHADPSSVTSGEATTVTFSWSYSNAPAPAPVCTIDHGVGMIATGEARAVTISADTLYTLTCTNDGGSDSGDTTIAVVPAPVAPVVASFQVAPSSVTSGEATSVTFSWTYSNVPDPAPTCTIDRGVGTLASGDARTVTISADTLYTLTCTNTGGSDTAGKTITAVPVVPVVAVTDSIAPAGDRQLPFGGVASGSNLSGTVTVANAGNAALVLGTVATANQLATPFSITADTCSGQTLAPAATCTVTVLFAPSATGAFSDAFDVPSNDPATPSVTLSVSGTGVAPAIAVSDSIAPAGDHQLLFGDVTQGVASNQTVTVTSAGTASLVLGTIASANPLAAPFSITADTCSGQSLAPAATCTITVRFMPSDPAAYSDAFDIPSNDPATPSLTFSLAGAGVAPNVWPAPIAATGQAACFTAGGASLACAGSGQDGELRSGVSWPVPRFMRGAGAESECITDGLTGLVWSRDANLPAATTTWQGALDWVAALNAGVGLCGRHDWRLLNKNELRSLASYGESNVSIWLNAAPQGFLNVQSSPYWSSTTGTLAGDVANAWAVNMMDGYLLLTEKAATLGGHQVWPVRAGSTTAPAPAARTGQTLCYTTAGAITACAGTGQDGDLQQGVGWPASRFTANADTSLTDGLTGLRWGPDAGTPTFSSCSGGAMKWQNALTWIACLNTNGYLGHADWRLPNVNELQSLANADDTLGLWLANQGFAGTTALVPIIYWTSDSRSATPSVAWVVNIGRGMPAVSKTGANYLAWPVRGP